MTPVHVAAGLLALGAGAVALCAAKGAGVHRRSGMVFVYAMLTMSGTGAGMAALRAQSFSVIAGLLTFYMVSTALLTVRHIPRAPGWIDAGAAWLALAVGAASLSFGVVAASRPGGQIAGQPAALGFIFGVVALLAALGDLRVIRGRALHGPRRLARHLWRMCFAMFVATASFFLGQPHVFPEPVRRSGVLAIPVLLVLSLMVYWLVRMRLRQRSPRPVPVLDSISPPRRSGL